MFIFFFFKQKAYLNVVLKCTKVTGVRTELCKNRCGEKFGTDVGLSAGLLAMHSCSAACCWEGEEVGGAGAECIN